MEWLLTHMWMALAGVGLFGILLGWAVRGIMVMSKFHRAIGEKEIANAELAEARNELDVLLKAQRGEIPVQPRPVAAGGADDILKGELKDREKRLSDLAGELAKSKSELEALKSSKPRGGAAVAAVGGAVVGAGATVLAGKDDDESPSLAWRNRHLEARLKELEGQVETLGVAAEQAPVGSVVPVAATVVGALSAEDKVAADKAAWKVTYLNQRIDALEDEVMAMPVAVAAAAEPVSGMAVVDAAEPEAEVGAIDEELARLRWRNRYLEGRVAYFDGESKQADEGEEDNSAAGLVAGAGAAAAAIAAVAISRDEEEADPEVEVEIVEEADETSVEAVTEAVEAISAEAVVEDGVVEDDGGSVSDAILKSLTQVDEEADAQEAAPEIESADADSEITDPESEAVEVEDVDVAAGGGVELAKPLALDSPVGGQPDDLTVIGGVGPKIQEVLNGLGVYHYDQIAAWTPENIAWIDDHLSFSGRIDREGWVEQALILAGDD